MIQKRRLSVKINLERLAADGVRSVYGVGFAFEEAGA